jgi:hypothetical protein
MFVQNMLSRGQGMLVCILQILSGCRCCVLCISFVSMEFFVLNPILMSVLLNSFVMRYVCLFVCLFVCEGGPSGCGCVCM